MLSANKNRVTISCILLMRLFPHAALTRSALIGRCSLRMKKYPTRIGLMEIVLRNEYCEIDLKKKCPFCPVACAA